MEMPYNDFAEKALIGAIIVDSTKLSMLPAIPIEAFTPGPNKTIWEAINALKESEQPIELTTVAAFLERSGRLESVGYEYLASLYEYGAIDVEYQATVILEEYDRRRIIGIAHEAIKRIKNGDTASEVADYIVDSSQNLEVFKTSTTIAPQDSYEKLLQRMEEGRSNIITSGFDNLDVMLQIRGGQLITVAARPAMGKSAFADQLACQIAVYYGPSLFVSLEMGEDEIINRRVSRFTGVPVQRIANSHLSAQEKQRIYEARSDVMNAQVFVMDSPSPTPQEIMDEARRLKRTVGLSCIFIDYLQIMAKDPNDVSELSKLTRSFKVMSRQMKVPVFLLSQLSRGVESRQDRRPILSDLRGSGSIEQDSDAVLFIYRNSYYDRNDDGDEAEIIIAKQRSGPTGTAILRFDGYVTRFSD